MQAAVPGAGDTVTGKHSSLRFAHLSDDERSAKKRKLIPANTERANQKAAKMLNDYIKERAQAGLDIQFENLDRNELNSLLSRFYMDARTVKGEFYKVSSLENFRHSLNRYLQSLKKN